MSRHESAPPKAVRQTSLKEERRSSQIFARSQALDQLMPAAACVEGTVRLDKILTLRRAIAAGTYCISAEKVAEAMLRRSSWREECGSEYPA